MAETERVWQSASAAADAAPAGASTFSEAEFDIDALALAEQSAGIGVWSIDLTTGLVRGTAQFFRIMGLAPAGGSVHIDTLRALRHPEDRERVLAGFRRALDGGADSYEIEYRIIRPGGDVRWVFGRGRVVRDENGEARRYSGVDLDITERKAAEAALAAAKEELERMNQVLEERVRERTVELAVEAERRMAAESRLHQAQKMEAVGQLTGGIAHDFNNILQVLMGNLEIARLALRRDQSAAPSPSTREALTAALERAQKASMSAQQLVQRLLAFGRAQKLEPRVLDANGLIREMADMIARTIGETIELETVLIPELWPVSVDVNQLESALLNLVVNARDAMPDGGSLRIETSNVRISPDEAQGIPPGDYVMLCVSDTGCGIDKQVIDRVFEPFFSTKDTGKGSGLGLSMVYGFVKQSGGHVRIDSEVGVGSNVRLLLPRSMPASEAQRAMPAQRVPGDGVLPRARPGETVLLVEDNEEVLRHGVSALENLGYRVLKTSDGPSALRLLDASDAPRIDLLFTDVVLPGGMSGRALAEAIKARQPHIPVLFTTGYTRDAILNQARLNANLPVLDKPYTIENLSKYVRQAIDQANK